MKLTKSLPVIKERNCSASLVLDCRTQRKNATEFPLAMRFTVDRKFFYHQVGGSYSEKRFSDICTATKSSSENYKEQKMWREEIVPRYKEMLVNLNKGNPFTYEMVRVVVTTGNANVEVAKEVLSSASTLMAIRLLAIFSTRASKSALLITTNWLPKMEFSEFINVPLFSC